MSTDQNTWYPWQADDGLWHAACIGPDNVRRYFRNIGFEDKDKCHRYIVKADRAELFRMAIPVPAHMVRTEDSRGFASDQFSSGPGNDPENSPAGPPEDPRFDWVEISTMSGDRTWIKGKCHHLTPAPVDLRTGELVAWWCPDCGDQFDRDRWPCPEHLWIPLPEINRPPVPRTGSTPSGASSNGFELWVYGDGHRPDPPVNPYTGPCPHKQRDWHWCAVCTAPDTPKPGPYGFDPYPRRDPDDPDYVIMWQNPRMDDDGGLIPWTRWAHDTVLLPVWNKVKDMTRTYGPAVGIMMLYGIMLALDIIGGFD